VEHAFNPLFPYDPVRRSPGENLEINFGMRITGHYVNQPTLTQGGHFFFTTHQGFWTQKTGGVEVDVGVGEGLWNTCCSDHYSQPAESMWDSLF
jgi:hypothetical protein